MLLDALFLAVRIVARLIAAYPHGIQDARFHFSPRTTEMPADSNEAASSARTMAIYNAQDEQGAHLV